MTKEWFYREDNFVRGPMLPPALKQCANQGLINRDTKVRKGMNGKWMKASRVRGLFPESANLDPSSIEEIEDELDPEIWGDHHAALPANPTEATAAGAGDSNGSSGGSIGESKGPTLPDSSDFEAGLFTIRTSTSGIRKKRDRSGQRGARQRPAVSSPPTKLDWDAFARNTDLVVRRTLLAALVLWLLCWVVATVGAFMGPSPEGLSLMGDMAKRMYVPTFYFGSYVATALLIWFITRR